MPPDAETPAEYFAQRVAWPEAILIASTLLAIILSRLTVPSAGAFLAFIAAAVACLIDMKTFALIPPSMWAAHHRKAATYAALGTCAVFALFLLGVLLSTRFSFGLFAASWLVRALVPGTFTLYWYRRFAEEIFPNLQSLEHERSVEEFARRIEVAGEETKLADAEKGVETRREDAERRGRRQRAIREARAAVFQFFCSFSTALQPFVSGERLQAEMRVAIPDTATEEEAFAGACGLLTRLEGHIQGLEAERKVERADRQQRRERITALESEIAGVGEEIQTLRSNTALDPELRDAEIQSLEAGRRSLMAKRTMLYANAA